MIALDRAQLARVCGGDGVGAVTAGMNVELVKGKHLDVQRALTDYGYCTATVRQTCKDANGGWLWGTYDKAAAQCTFDTLPKVCGLPAVTPADTSAAAP